jgi:hypothetical protein
MSLKTNKQTKQINKHKPNQPTNPPTQTNTNLDKQQTTNKKQQSQEP